MQNFLGLLISAKPVLCLFVHGEDAMTYNPKDQGDEGGGSWDFDGLSPAGVSTWSHEVVSGSVSLDKRSKSFREQQPAGQMSSSSSSCLVSSFCS